MEPPPKKTRMKRVTASHTKHRNAEQSRKTRQQMVNLRDQIDRWKHIFQENNCQHDGDVAKLLIDRYLMYDAVNDGDETDSMADKSVIHSLVMECETISENSTKGERVNRNKTDKDMLVDFTCIHGLPLNLPFKLRYTSEALDRVLDSKVYIIVEQSTVGDLALQQMNSIQIEVEGGIEEVLSGNMRPASFLQTIQLGNMYSSVDMSNHIGSNREIMKTYITNRQIEAADVSHHQITGNENLNHKSDKAEEIRNDKFEIVSDILDSVLDRVVKHCYIHSDNPSEQNTKPKTSKRKSITDICSTNRKEKLLKIDNSPDTNLPYSSRMRSKGYRVNYAQLDDFDYEINTTDVEVSDSDESSLLGTDNDSDNDSVTVKSKGKKKVEDPDFKPEVYTVSKKRSQCTSRTTVDLLKSQSIDTVSDKSLEKKLVYPNKRHLRLSEKSKRIKVTLSEHKDKYFFEEHMSVERKDRGKNDSEKTYQLLVCAECRKFRTEDELQMEKHLEFHVNGDFICKNCDFIGTSMFEINMHKHQHSKPRKLRQKYLCYLCSEKYCKQDQYHEHLVAVHNLNPWLCTICSTKEKPVTFKDQNAYKQHYLENHRSQMIQCCSCGLLYLDRTDLRLHVCIGKEHKRHTNCDICGKEMMSTNLNAHKKKVHFNVRPFPCSQCNYAARTALHLTDHVNAKHEGVHSHKCDQCNFTCVRAFQLVSHKRTHTGDKPYKCDQCPYAAAWNVQLKEHKKLHGGTLIEHCKICGVVVKFGAAYTKHMKKEHGEDE